MKAWNYLSGWTSFSLPKNIQKRLYKFLLRKAIGQFLQNELDLENFDIELMNGSVELRDLDLNLQTLNKLLNDTPFILEEGRVASINASIPWTTFWSGDISLKIQGLHLALRPIKNKPKSSETNPSTPTNEEPIMSSSLHFADDFLKSEIETDATQRELHESIQKSFPTEEVDDLESGLQVLTKVIDKMLAKIKIDIVDTLIRIIHKSAVPLVDVPGDNSGNNEYFIDIRVPRISYFDETPEFNNSAAVEQELMQQSVNNLVESSILLPPATNETIKCIIMTSPEIWLRSSPTMNLNDSIYLLQSQSETTINDTNIQGDCENDLAQTEFFETDQGTSSLFQHNNMSGSITPKAMYQRQQQHQSKPYETLLFTTMNERNYVRMKLRPTVMDTSFLPIKQVDFLVSHIRTIISPLQVAFFMDLLDAMTPTSDSNTPSEQSSRRPSNTSTTDTNRPASSSTTNSHHVDSVLDDLDSFHTPTNNTPPPLHFATGSSYYEQQQQQQKISVPDRKIKIGMSLVELFILGDDDHSVIDWDQPQKNKTHIRFAIEQLNFRLQQFALNSSSVIGIKITNIVLDEWIKRPAESNSNAAEEMNDRSRTKYEIYNPILQFDNKIKGTYRDEELFPSYNPQDQVYEEAGNGGGEVVRVRIERKKQQSLERNKSRFSVDNLVSACDEDINVEIQAFKLQIDPRIVDKLENYIIAIMDYSKRKEEEQQQFSYTTQNQQEQQQRHPPSSVFDDLQQQENTLNRKIRVRCAFIRVLLFVPDMSLTSTREEFNDRFHKSQLSLDIKKLVATWSSKDQPPIDEETAGFVLKDKKKPTKLNVELNYVNVFMQLKQDELAKTWFTAKTSQGKKYFSEGALCPTIEILIHDPNTIYPTTSARRSGYFGAGSDIPFNLFDFLSRNENFDGEQKLHVPMEDQSESAMIFKQRTMETSMFVVNCHFPQTHMNLTKPLWDKVQIIQNDLLLWQPRFLIQPPVDDLMSSSSMSMMSQSHERLAYHPRRFSQQPHSLAPPTSSIQPSQTQQKTLFSIVAVLSSGVWDIHTSDINNYRFQFSEFRYFAAMKHLGANENITTLDIEELSLTDTSNPTRPIPLLYKTIPKSIHPKRDTSMVSLFSRLTSYPESNRISKVTSIVACNICWKATPDIEFINQIIDFQKVPEDMVFIDPPTQYIKVFAHVLEASVDYEPINSPSRAVLLFDGVQVITDILAGQPFIDVKTCIETVDLLLIDDVKELKGFQRLEGKTSDARKFWSTVGLVDLLTVSNIELQVKLKLDPHAIGPQIDVALVSTDIGLDSSTDSFQTLLNLITFISNNGDAPPSETQPKQNQKQTKKKMRRQPHQMNSKPPGSDLLASLDENAFRTSPTSSKISPPTLIEAPDMEEFNYVEEFYTTSNKDTSSSIFINHAARPPTKPRRKQHRMKTAEDIIRVLVSPDEQEFVVEDYFGIEKKVVEPKSAVDINKAVLSLRVSHVNLVWKLYDGYAWEYVRAEMTAQKKKQDGFTEEEIKTTTDAFIEIKLDDISVDFDFMPSHDETAIYFRLLIKDVEIIDNMKTSSYKKFLGYMKQAVKENPRELDACMVDLQLISLRPVVDDPQQEFRLKAKILPVRLYVDQDALNFLVRYFTFEKSHLRSTHAANQSIMLQQPESPNSDSDEDEEEGAKDDDGMFFQYVDIYPITLKVDYKPKYINYGNIKEGQLAELVNLFHLDGAEMSLSHVKLTGIKGIDGLLERLGQEWLPHIKNTQVTNMVSGVSPIRSIVNLSNGVADLVLLPIQQYKKDGRLIKGIQRGTSSFARATAIEAIKLSSKMATGTQVILEHADGFFSPPSPTNTTSQLLQDQNFVYTDIYGIDIPDDHDEDMKKKKQKEKAAESSAPESSKSSSSNRGNQRRPPSLSASPSDLSEGFQIAYQNLSKNLGSAAQTIFAVPTEIAHQQESGDTYYNAEKHGASGSSSSKSRSGTKAVIRAVPVAVIKPMIGLTGAFQSILTGLRNSIDPVMRLQSQDKYKKRK